MRYGKSAVLSKYGWVTTYCEQEIEMTDPLPHPSTKTPVLQARRKQLLNSISQIIVHLMRSPYLFGPLGFEPAPEPETR